ncbi:cytochrome c [Sagittula salina]|nr:cytochrome c [Sagittula salina]
MRASSLILLAILALAAVPFKAAAEERLLTLHAAPELIESGLIKYLLPRFTLKTQVRVNLTEPPTDATLDTTAAPLFLGADGAGGPWGLTISNTTDATARFEDWLTGEIGLKTVLAYAPEGAPLYAAAERAAEAAPVLELTGDVAEGYRVSRAKCARCHSVDEATRMTSIGSTPSFAVLRALPGWADRFVGFYVLNPHPAFTQVAEVTPPFDEARPSPIVPIHMTLEEVDHVLAYVATLAAADLGAPLAQQ